MKSTIAFLRSESFVFIALIFIILGQMLHTAYLFETVRRADLTISLANENWSGLNWAHAIICAFAIEAAILMFILHGKKLVGQFYALASFASNLLYYNHWEASIDMIATSVLISAMLSGSIWFFSELLTEKLDFKSKAASNGSISEDDSKRRKEAMKLFGIKG